MGRPSFKPTEEQRAEVERWVKAKVTIEEMARRLKLAEKTFRKYFASELGLIPAEAVNTGLAAARPRTEAYRPTDEQREWVTILSGARWPYADIAQHLHISREMLEEHFADDLALGPTKFSAEVIKATYRAALAGNQTAAKICLLMNGAGEPDPGQQPSREGLRGKKETAAIVARTAEQGTGWEELVPSSGKPN